MTPNLAKRRILTTAILSLAVAASFLPSTVTAQESDSWEFRVTPYLWMLGLDGTTAVLGEDADVDASFSDILDLLNIALSVNMELSKGNVFFVMDAMYAQLEMDFEGPGPVAGDIGIDLIIREQSRSNHRQGSLSAAILALCQFPDRIIERRHTNRNSR